MKILIYPLLVVAAVGFVALFAIHVAALFGVTYPFERFIGLFGPGLFVVFVPMIFVMNRLTRDFKQKDIWRAALRGCPAWMRRAVWVIGGYAWLGFFLLPVLYGGGMEAPSNKARVMSAGLMIFYLIPFAVLYSATRVTAVDEGRRCLSGHPVTALANFCEECGAPVAPPPTV